MAEIVLSHVKKVYPNESEKKGFFGKKKSKEKKHNLQVTDEGVLAVQDFNLTVHDHEFVVFVGPSGCGKSTTLRMIAGLEEITDGELLIDGKRMNDVAPKDRDIAMVFQSYALYPNMTVYQNMAFTLELKKVPKDVIDKKVRAAAETLGITQSSTASRRRSPAASASASPRTSRTPSSTSPWACAPSRSRSASLPTPAPSPARSRSPSSWAPRSTST